MAAALGGALLGVAAFRIRHCSFLSVRTAAARIAAGRPGIAKFVYPECYRAMVLAGFKRTGQVCKRIPPSGLGFGIRGDVAGAGFQVQVLTTARTKTLAVFRAERARGQGEQHLFAHDILKRQTTLFIIPDFRLIEGNGALAGLGVCVLGAEDEVELAAEGGGDGLHAAGAEQFERAAEGGAKANVGDLLAMAAILDEEVGAAGDGNGADLGDVGGVVERAGGDGLGEDQGLSFELEGGDEHVVKVRASGGAGQLGLVGVTGSTGAAGVVAGGVAGGIGGLGGMGGRGGVGGLGGCAVGPWVRRFLTASAPKPRTKMATVAGRKSSLPS
jgi:hypothetical protein